MQPGAIALYKGCTTSSQTTHYDITDMTKLFHPLLAMLASSTDRELAKYVQFLKEENRILRARVPGKEIHTRSAERARLLKYGKALGRSIEELITIVSPSTFYRWVREDNGKPRRKNAKGGQRKPKEIRELVLQIAATTGFGYTRILGELRKLGIRRISRQTVRNILKEEGIQPGPDRTSDSWEEFIKRHGETLWAADFFSVRTVTARGLRTMYVMVWLCMESREMIVSPSTEHPNSAWVVDQTKVFMEETGGRDQKPAIVMHDRDSKFTKEFVAALNSRGIRNNALPKASPNLNGRCERAILSLRQECLSKFIVFGKRHLDHLLSSYMAYYNTRRSHMCRDHLPPVRDLPDEVETLSLDDIEVRTHVGGLIHSFHRKAA